jgi:hypothetical protein
MKAKISIDNQRLLHLLFSVVCGLSLTSLITKLYAFYFPDQWPVIVVSRLFDVDAELNLPSFVSTVMLWTCALLLAGVTAIKRSRGESYTARWGLLAVIFTLLGWDEAVSLHERLMAVNLLRTLPKTVQIPWVAELFHFSWVVVGVPVTLAVGVAYGRWFLALPRQQRRLLLVAIALYLGGALGMEMVGGIVQSLFSLNSVAYIFSTSVEELLEMSGMAVLIYTLLEAVRAYLHEVQVEFAKSPVQAIARPLLPAVLEERSGRHW